jgi:NTE family protein
VPQIDLVLEGGGVKGLGLVGAIAVLEEHGFSFAHVAGTSAGAIVGALVAAGIPATEVHEMLCHVDWTRFRDGGWLDHLGVPGKAISALASQGMYSGEYFTTWLGGLLAEHGVVHFADLRTNEADSTLPPHHWYRLVVMTSDVSQGELRRLPWDYPRYGLEPDQVRVVDAVRASMAIPFFYAPVKVQDRTTGTESWLVDGGLLSNFPVDVFDRSDGKPPRWPTVGIKLSAQPGARQGVRNVIVGSASLTRAMLQTMMGSHDQLVLDDPAVLARTIAVDTMKVRATDFDIDGATQDQLYVNGRKAATDFLASMAGKEWWITPSEGTALAAPG